MRALSMLALLAACGGGSSSTSPQDAAVDATSDSGLPATCTGACQTTQLTAMFAATRTLDHAFYGVTMADATLHVEAYGGGATDCPTATSPTPQYTLVLGKVATPTSTAPSTSPANLLDYQGDLLGGPLGAAATSVTVTPVAANPGQFVALDLQLGFAAGTVTGHLYASHCTSLDTP